MPQTSNQKRECRILCRAANKYCRANNLFGFGLLVSTVFVATINVVQVDGLECGTVNLYRDTILGGKEVMKDEWPFIAALYYSSTSKYFCGGTIISQKHVLTAAHCIQTKGKGDPLSPDEITVHLGAYNLTDRSERDVVDRNVTDIRVHPDWKYNEERYDADIAILVLNENISFSNHIRPVCMPPATYLLDGLVGTVVGWGRTENGTAEGIPRKIEINALNDTYCYETDKGIARYASERSFCGEGSGSPNNGDSGGGFFVVAGSGWVQFGTVSFVRPKETGNTLKVALYMKLTSLSGWIADIVEKSGSIISVATTKADLNCTYDYSFDFYCCWLFDLNIRQEDFVVKNFTGSHKFFNENEDVEEIAFKTGVMASLPRNFGNIFRNLKLLIINVDVRRIFRSNFQNLGGLERIRCINSNIAELDEDSLWDLPNLQSLELKKNEVKVLHAATFSRNCKLKEVQVVSNALIALPPNLFRNNLLLESVSFDDNSIEMIADNVFETNANLSTVSLKGNRLRHLSATLFQYNSELQFIDLSNNLIQTIDEHAFTANTKLLSLNLISNKLQFLPAQLLQGMTLLKEIFFSENSLKVIDERFFEANIEVEVIFLKANQLTRIPSNLFRNNSLLRFCHLGKNSIESIDENQFAKNSFLQKLSMEFNRLAELPANLFKHNPQLKYVNFRGNLLETVDERTFETTTQLLEVYFDNNYLRTLPANFFQNNSLLNVVHFDENSLENLDDRTFANNIYLREVSFSANLMNYLPEKLFRNNRLLQIVQLNYNLFPTLHANLFTYNPYLRQFSLQQGILQSLPKNLFRRNSRLKFVDFRGNRLRTIETNFTVLEHAFYISLAGNDCIDMVFYDEKSDVFKFRNEIKRTNNLTEFQSLVMANCS